mmetsp:Transcript_4010/g.5934  ORF Transcript_4010/g.5934 Transcript_4010/m.5934 type:complete len:217 (-) Transcript_4010:272-922(-)
MFPQTMLPPSPTSPIDLVVTPVMTKRKKEATAPPAPKKGRCMPRNRIPGDVYIPFNPFSSSINSNTRIVPNTVRFAEPSTPTIFQAQQEYQRQHQERYEFNDVRVVAFPNGTLNSKFKSGFPISASTTSTTAAQIPLTPSVSTPMMTDNNGYRFSPAVTPDERGGTSFNHTESTDPARSRPSITNTLRTTRTFNQSFTSHDNFSTGMDMNAGAQIF